MATEIDRSFIIAEIKRCAEANGGKAPGQSQFSRVTGIPEYQWSRHWPRWSEAVAEAGYSPNVLQGRLDDEVLLTALADLAQELGRMPSAREMKQRAHVDPSFPSHNTFSRFGGKAQLVVRLLDFVETRSKWSDVAEIIPPVPIQLTSPKPAGDPDTTTGFVYLMKSGKYHKIGKSNSVGRRAYEVGLQLPEAVTLVHEIETDDPAGIEQYWHRRFADRRTRGEWFRLTADDIAAFKRRRFM